MNLRIEIEEANDFIRWCRRTIRQRSKWDSVRPYDLSKDAIVFSFDAEYAPVPRKQLRVEPPGAENIFSQSACCYG
jgi:hypothetical protein